MTYSAETGVSPIALADGATATVIVEGTVELHGADAEGRTGATPAIEVPETATLIVYGAHDEELAGTDEAPKDSLIVTGGDPAAGENGQNGKGTAYDGSETSFTPTSGAGGNGGGGGAAAIGGRGGDGGAGGMGTTGSQTFGWDARGDWVAYWKNNELQYIEGDANDDTVGREGQAGGDGEQGGACGSVYLLGRLNVTASATGENAMGGNGGNGDGGGDNRDYNPGLGGGDTWEMYGGPAGGGGGGGGTAAPAIGCGGAGGSGGGGGATGASDDGNSWDTATWPYTCPGGSGGGGWPNGGGGGGGGQTNANRIVYNKSLGGAGGAGGKENGVVGYPGYIDVNHGERIDFNYCGYAGNGAGGLDSGAASAGDRTYSNGLVIGDPNPYGGQGGAGGGPVTAREWTSAGSAPVLVLSTAGNYDLSVAADLDYAYGAGSGSGAGSRVAADARVVYEVEDLSYDPVGTPENSYIYTGKRVLPEVTFGDTASYNAGSDRDDAIVPGASEVTIPVATTGEMRYGDNTHCPRGDGDLRRDRPDRTG